MFQHQEAILRKSFGLNWNTPRGGRHHDAETCKRSIIVINCILLSWCFSDRATWIDYILITNLFIKYYFPLHVSSLKCSSSGGYNCTHAAYGTVTLYKSSWWPVGTQLEWELSLSLKLCTDRPPWTLVESDSTICCMYTTVSSWRWVLEARNMQRRIIFYE